MSVEGVRPLNRLGLRHLVSGSVAPVLQGEPRLAHDVNLVVCLRDKDLVRLMRWFG